MTPSPKKPSEISYFVRRAVTRIAGVIDNFVPGRFLSEALETVATKSEPAVREALISLLLEAKNRLPKLQPIFIGDGEDDGEPHKARNRTISEAHAVIDELINEVVARIEKAPSKDEPNKGL